MDPGSFFHVAVKVDDLDESLAFYRTHFDADLLDRRVERAGEGPSSVDRVALSVADKRVYLFEEAPYEAAGLEEDLPTGFLHFGFTVPDVEAAHESLANDGVEFVMEPTEFGDLTFAFLLDPTGTRIELIERD